MNLLHAFILKQEPLAFVNSKHSWPGEGSESLLEERLRLLDPEFPRRDGSAYLFFDEGQDTYVDEILWNKFFKGGQ